MRIGNGKERVWPEVFGDLAGVARDLRRVEAEGRYRRDAWAWVSELVTTVDEADGKNPLKPFPVAVCERCERYMGYGERGRCVECGGEGKRLVYLEAIARQWQSGRPSLLILPKARRMRLSWLMIALHTWLAWTRPHANIFVVSSKEDKSAELIGRARGIISRLPEELMGVWRVQHRNTPPEIRFENGAKMMGVPEGADQLRQFTQYGDPGRRARSLGVAQRRVHGDASDHRGGRSVHDCVECGAGDVQGTHCG